MFDRIDGIGGIQMNVWDYVNSILQKKTQLIIDDETEDAYVPFLTNRSLSYHNDCVMFVNEMNRRHHLDKKMQFDFLLNTIRGKKRQFAKWVKPEKETDLQTVKQFYNYSDQKAREALRLLTKEQIEMMKNKLNIGGTKT